MDHTNVVKSEHTRRVLWAVFAIVGVVALMMIGSFSSRAIAALGPSAAGPGDCNLVTAKVVALDQPIVYNRYGEVNPISMMFALRRDVVHKDTGLPETANSVCGRQRHA